MPPAARPLIIVAITSFVLLPAAALFWMFQPDVRWLNSENPQTTPFVERRKVSYQVIFAPVPVQRWIPLNAISPHLQQAVILAEDQRFFHHRGLDWKALKKSLVLSLREGSIVAGGSTLTQQLAKNLFLSPARTWLRKIREARIAMAMERSLRKDRILELYLNVAEWGPGIYGIEAASRIYFGKPAIALTVSESVQLASTLPNPALFSPLDRESVYLKCRRFIIAHMMRRGGFLDRISYQAALSRMGIDRRPDCDLEVDS